jgi:hypothetical protein
VWNDQLLAHVLGQRREAEAIPEKDYQGGSSLGYYILLGRTEELEVFYKKSL